MAEAKGKLLEEMTTGEYRDYLEEEAEKQADFNREQFEKQQEAYKDSPVIGTLGPTDKTNDELREQNAAAVDAELAIVKTGEKKASPAKKANPSTPPPNKP